VTFEARAGAPRGYSRATLHALFLPLILVPVGCRYDQHRYWHDRPYYESYHRREVPAPRVYQPVAPPVFVVPRAPPSLPSQPAYVPPRPPERRFEHHHERPPQRSGGDLGRHLNRDSRPDQKRGR
jgi:hypothetical protein